MSPGRWVGGDGRAGWWDLPKEADEPCIYCGKPKRDGGYCTHNHGFHDYESSRRKHGIKP